MLAYILSLFPLPLLSSQGTTNLNYCHVSIHFVKNLVWRVSSIGCTENSTVQNAEQNTGYVNTWG